MTLYKRGYRWSIAASLMRRRGFASVVNVADGMAAWKASGYPISR